MGTRTSGSEGGGEQTTARKRGTAARLRPYFSIVQRKVLEPNNFASLAELARTLNAFEQHWNEIAEPFDWRFTRDDLAALMERLAVQEPQLRLITGISLKFVSGRYGQCPVAAPKPPSPIVSGALPTSRGMRPVMGPPFAAAAGVPSV